MLVRQMGREFVDRFFATGELRLPSIESLRKLEDASRRDSQEGLHAITARPGSGILNSIITGGPPTYVLCASDVAMPPTSSPETRVLIIEHPQEFALAIARRLSNVRVVRHELCRYSSDRLQHFPFKVPGSRGKDMLLAVLEQNESARIEACFLKHARFAGENEYRFLWVCDGEPTREVFPICPEARIYCRIV